MGVSTFTERLLKPVYAISLYSSLFYETSKIYKAIHLLKEISYVNITPSNQSHWFMAVRLQGQRYEELEKRFSRLLQQQKNYINKNSKSFDFFICHASEDKETFVNELSKRLSEEGYKVWYDDFIIKWGDSIRRKIDEGLKKSKYGIVILSYSFFNKKWPQEELDGLFELEGDEKKILPIWLYITHDEVKKYSAMIAGKRALKVEKGNEKETLNVIIKEAKSLFRS